MTQYSGITPDMLKDVTTRLEDVQRDLRALLPSDCILVGQGLNNDLKALKMMHPYVIDTSVIFNITGMRRRKTKLALLSEIFLGRTIQSASRKGHDPEEDASAAMQLVKLKLEKGYEYGDALLRGQMPSTIPTTTSADEVVAVSVVDELKRREKKVYVVCSRDSSSAYDEDESYVDKVEDKKEAVAKAQSAAFENDFISCHVKASKWSSGKKLTKKLLSHTSNDGIFIVVWAGDEDRNAFVGLKMPKEPIDFPLQKCDGDKSE